MELKESRADFLAAVNGSLGDIYDALKQVPPLKIVDLPKDRSALLVVDVINGFLKEGQMAAPTMMKMVPSLVEVITKAQDLSWKTIAFADAHDANAQEFAVFPPHCLKNTEESQLINEIKDLLNDKVIEKNSTNGFFAPKFQGWIKDNPQIDHFVLVGDCTDICVLQLALSLKQWFNESNQPSRIIISMKDVDTFSAGVHDDRLMNVLALYLLQSSGIELAQELL